MSHSPFRPKKDGRLLVLAAALIVGIRLARDPRAGHKSERVIYAIEDAVFLADAIYELALLRHGARMDYCWDGEPEGGNAQA